jgi:prepilin-type N-terminal cleavage/methylation domain-containing protein/prepilin-type processing-associated H-X9-DG protein
MNRRFSNSSRGFTLVELLVVISIIGVLMSLTLPAINSAREAGRRAVCTNNIRQVGQGLINHDVNKRKLPGFAGNPTRNTSATTVSWAIAILPQFGGNDFKSWEEANQALTTFGYREIYVCPSDPPDRPTTPQLSYVINTGESVNDPTNPNTVQTETTRNKGISFQNPEQIYTSISRGKLIVDSLPQTLLVSENLNAGNYTDTAKHLVGFVWFSAVPTASSSPERLVNGRWSGWKIGDANVTATNTDRARPSSFHPGGVNVVFCDGSTKFMREDVDYAIYRSLMTSNGARVTPADLTNINEGDFSNQ